MVRENIKGYQVILDSPGRLGKRELFVDSKTWLPMFEKVTITGDPGADTFITTVTKTVTVESDGTPITFPVRMEWKCYKENKMVSSGYGQVDEKTLKINQPIDDEIFTIPLSEAFTLVDEGVIIELRQA